MPEHQQVQQSKKSDTTFQKQATSTSQTHVSNPYSIIQRAKINPKSLTHADIMQLQRTIGNRAVGRLLSSIGSSSTAQQATVQRQEITEKEDPCPSCMQRQEISEEDEKLQMKSVMQRQEIPEGEEPPQGNMIGTIQRQETLEEDPLQTKRENNTGMPDNLKAGVENLSGIDMSDVGVHYNSDKPAEVGALAYTQGTEIHVAPGQEKHLPHEAWHVVQQAQGRVQPTIQMKGTMINDDVGLESEADIMGDKAMQLKVNVNADNNVIQRITGRQVSGLYESARQKNGLVPNLLNTRGSLCVYNLNDNIHHLEVQVHVHLAQTNIVTNANVRLMGEGKGMEIGHKLNDEIFSICWNFAHPRFAQVQP